MSDDIKLADVVALRDESLAAIKQVKAALAAQIEPHATTLRACEQFITEHLADLGPEATLARKFALEDDMAALASPTAEVAAALAASQTACETFMHAHLTSKNLQNIKLTSGMQAFLQKGSSCSVQDWDTVLGDILRAAPPPDGVTPEQWDQYLLQVKHFGNFQILVQNVSKKAVKEIVDAKGAPPDGIKYETFKTVQFRRGNAK